MSEKQRSSKYGLRQKSVVVMYPGPPNSYTSMNKGRIFHKKVWLLHSKQGSTVPLLVPEKVNDLLQSTRKLLARIYGFCSF